MEVLWMEKNPERSEFYKQWQITIGNNNNNRKSGNQPKHLRLDEWKTVHELKINRQSIPYN